MLLIPVFIILFLIISYFIYGAYKAKISRWYYIRKSRDNRPKWDLIIKDKFKYYSSLDSQSKEKLLDYISIMFFEKLWADTFDEEEKVQEAAKASLPILNRSTNFYPMIKVINEKRSFKQWLEIHETQFQIDHGKSTLREFNDNFSNYSIQYFDEPKVLKNEAEKIYFYLNHFYKQYP